MCEKFPTWLRATLLSIVVLLLGMAVWSMRWEPLTVGGMTNLPAANCVPRVDTGDFLCPVLDRWTKQVHFIPGDPGL